MPKQRRSTREEFYDVFADFDLADQDIVLEFLSEIHRQAKRQAGRGKPVVKADRAEVHESDPGDAGRQ